MDIDPLQDSAPPRYAVESDDSEDELGSGVYPERIRPQYKTNVVIRFGWSGEGQRPMVVGVGAAGRAWAAGLELGQPLSQIELDDTQVGEVYQLGQTQTIVVLVSHTFPEWAVHTVASTLLKSIDPSRVVIIDTYPVPAYISATPPRALDHPIRFLGTSSANIKPTSAIVPFESPNLIHSLSARLLSILEARPSTTGTLLLLPSLHISPPAPAMRPTPTSSRERWQAPALRDLHNAVFVGLGEKAGSVIWDAGRAREAGEKRGGGVDRRGDVGEGGMYI
ncbi:hypothetical protein BOTBODRAFT_144435 [Botryobasidium botryosum FD-172 SS1]|uniref:Proteasome assembly chaperone 1 n=1 Tax=Botryobasidium botryosum (strain FD-172 SS1) TaxID=930990 RepID=A0A067MM61_BOTB1|nr:hypothetical protein BOTBODRAFT_144435 [Botryobasidium botryosum FD-172 SS1]